MVDHTIEVRFKGLPSGIAAPEPLNWTRHFKNFAMTPEGYIIIKNFHPEFRDRLQAVLMDEGLPFSPILPALPKIA